jgi:hypothetical protein
MNPNTKEDIKMGYRSEVAFIVPDSAPRFEEIEDCFDHITEKEGYRLYYADWLKWYEDAEVVMAVTNYLTDLHTEDKTEEFLFIRLGEDVSDIEEDGQFWDNPFELGWSRKIRYSLI